MMLTDGKHTTTEVPMRKLSCNKKDFALTIVINLYLFAVALSVWHREFLDSQWVIHNLGWQFNPFITLNGFALCAVLISLISPLILPKTIRLVLNIVGITILWLLPLFGFMVMIVDGQLKIFEDALPNNLLMTFIFVATLIIQSLMVYLEVIDFSKLLPSGKKKS